MSLLSTNSLTVRIGDQSVCRELSFAINPGERWALLGRNGIGKTTLLHTLAGLRAPESGGIQLCLKQGEGKEISRLSPREIAQHLGILFQQQEEPFPSTVLETALIGRHPYLHTWEWESETDKDLARNALKQLKLDHLSDRQVSTLSGGERQRLALVTLLTQSPALMLLDEPTNHLDMHQQIAVLDHLQQWTCESERAVLATLHDVNLALRYFDHVILLLGNGEYLLGTTDKIINAKTLEQLYLHPVHEVEGEWGKAYLPR